MITANCAPKHICCNCFAKTNRGYSQKKIAENIECEIMQVVLDEARESYKGDIIMELQSDTLEQMEQNSEKIETWVKQWLANKTA